MISYDAIRDVHLEISSKCNAACPWCPRTFWGYTYNGGYPETYMTRADAEKIFDNSFLNQLESIRINGNFGDIVMNPEGPDVVDYFLDSNPDLLIEINTNGSARDRSFWKRLSRPGIAVIFALDGLEDTHHLYRQNTVWKQIIRNAQIVIKSGGRAVWKMIRFNHNAHQIEACRSLSKELGFHDFVLMEQGRDTAPVFDQHGNLVHILGNYQGPTEFKVLFHKKQTDDVLLEDIIQDRVPKKRIKCDTQIKKSIYVAANGDVSPCCWTGLYPKSYGKGQYHQAANRQLQPLIRNNNALMFPLRECIEWFSSVEKSWKNSSYQQGRLVICDDNCGV